MADDVITVHQRKITHEPIDLHRPTTSMTDRELVDQYQEEFTEGERAGMAGFVPEDAKFTINGMWVFCLGYVKGQAHAEKFV